MDDLTDEERAELVLVLLRLYAQRTDVPAELREAATRTAGRMDRPEGPAHE